MKLSDYFDGLVSDIDLQVELFIRNNLHCEQLVDEANAARDAYIAEIRECEAYNMSLLTDEKDDKLDEPQQQITQPKEPELNPAVAATDENASIELLFKRFCFIIELYKGRVGDEHFSWRLFSTDRYLTPAEIISFQELLKFTVNDTRNYLPSSGAISSNISFNLNLARCSLDRLFTDVDINPHVI
jgi:hypothetical protein